ncbi:MAG: radical SAM protein, partial [Desulfovibrionaceae bacterium]|nr:radical SAM protein [Desulfovibrionaceae bacterium]
FSFGQGCEGDPLVNAPLLIDAISHYRRNNGLGTINCNTNASRPEVIEDLAKAGLTSIRVSLNSSQAELYNRYYRGQNYSFLEVEESIKRARLSKLFISLNLLFFPGLTDTEEELYSLAKLVGENGVSMIQWRNLNIDPVWYFAQMRSSSRSPSMGLLNFMQRLKALCPWLIYGYFNPYLKEKANLNAPEVGTWKMPA